MEIQEPKFHWRGKFIGTENSGTKISLAGKCRYLNVIGAENPGTSISLAQNLFQIERDVTPFNFDMSRKKKKKRRCCFAYK